jgi:pimeloyl-ACP methyl ester carboxylesterase
MDSSDTFMQFQTRRYPVPGGINPTADVGGDPTGPTVILQHGGGQTRHSWGSAMGELVGRGYHVINLDTREHGESDWSPDRNYSFEAMASDFWAVIAATNLKANGSK